MSFMVVQGCWVHCGTFFLPGVEQLLGLAAQACGNSPIPFLACCLCDHFGQFVGCLVGWGFRARRMVVLSGGSCFCLSACSHSWGWGLAFNQAPAPQENLDCGHASGLEGHLLVPLHPCNISLFGYTQILLRIWLDRNFL